MSDPEILLVNVSGPDRPGITARLTGLLAAHQVELLDIGQANTHDWTTLAMLIRLAPGSNALSLLLGEAHGLELKVRFTPIAVEAYERWVGQQGQDRRIVSVMSRQLDAPAISRVAGILSLSGLNIDKITRLSGRASLSGSSGGPVSCVEFSVRGQPAAELGDAFLDVAGELGIDIAVQRDDAYRPVRRLLVFADEVLYAADPLGPLARAAGKADEDAALAAAGAPLAERVALLAGLTVEQALEAAGGLALAEGAEELLTTAHRLGFASAIVSGGPALVGEALAQRLGIDHVCGTPLEQADGALTGALAGEPDDDQARAGRIAELASRSGLVTAQVIAIGRRPGDLPMLKAAGVGVACCGDLGLDRLLYLIGIHQRDR